MELPLCASAPRASRIVRTSLVRIRGAFQQTSGTLVAELTLQKIAGKNSSNYQSNHRIDLGLAHQFSCTVLGLGVAVARHMKLFSENNYRVQLVLENINDSSKIKQHSIVTLRSHRLSQEPICDRVQRLMLMGMQPRAMRPFCKQLSVFPSSPDRSVLTKLLFVQQTGCWALMRSRHLSRMNRDKFSKRHTKSSLRRV